MTASPTETRKETATGTGRIDITRDVCPMTYVRVKLALERLEAGQTLEVLLSDGAPLKNVPRSAREEGHEVKLIEPAGNGVWRLVLEKRERS